MGLFWRILNWFGIGKPLPKCGICGKRIGGLEQKRCTYCGQTYCLDHRLPEEHACSGNPKAPPGGWFSYRADGTVEIGKGPSR